MAETRVTAAVITAAGAISVAVVSLIVKWCIERQDENQRRFHVMTALYAEIHGKFVIAEEVSNNLDIEAICDRMDNDPAYVPYVTLEDYASPVFDSSPIFHSAQADIPKMPAEIILAVMAFYQWDRLTHGIFASMQTDKYASLAVERRKSVLTTSGMNLKDLLNKGEDALGELDTHLQQRIPNWYRNPYR